VIGHHLFCVLSGFAKVVVIVCKNNGNHRSEDQRREEGFMFAKKVGRSGSWYFYFNVTTFLISLYIKLLKERITMTDKITFRYNGVSLKY